MRSRRYLLAKQAIAWDYHNKVLAPRQLDDFKNYQKARVMVAKYRQKIANQRLDQLQKFTTKLVKQYDIIVLENPYKNSFLGKQALIICLSTQEGV